MLSISKHSFFHKLKECQSLQQFISQRDRLECRGGIMLNARSWVFEHNEISKSTCWSSQGGLKSIASNWAPRWSYLLSAVIQIYHVWEGYLRKIPVLRQNFPRHSAREFGLSTGIFRKYPSQT